MIRVHFVFTLSVLNGDKGENNFIFIMGKNVVTALVPSFFDGSSSF